MAVAVLRRGSVRPLLRRRAFLRARRGAFTASRPVLAFEHTGDITIVVEVGTGLSASSLYGGSSGRARVRPIVGHQFFVRPRR
jgi:hypothetical protein